MKGLKSNLKGIPILLTAAFVWGVAFSAQSVGAEHLSAFSFTGLRFTIGFFALLPVIFLLEVRRAEKTRLKKTFLPGLLCGIVMFFAITLQQYGIQFGDNSGKAGFITCLYILIVPVISIFLKQFPTFNVWAGVILGIVGMYLLTFSGTSPMSFADLLLLISAFLWAAHIILVDKVARDIYPLAFSATQYLVAAVLSLICMVIFDTVTLNSIKSAAVPLLYGGIVSVGVGYTLQIVGQKFADPVPASLALSMESVFATLSGVILLGERLSTKGYIGCALIFVAIIIAQIPFKLKKKKNDSF